MDNSHEGSLNSSEETNRHPASRSMGISLTPFSAVLCAAALVILALGLGACNLLGPKNPSRSELLHAGNALVASLDGFREKIESDQDFKGCEDIVRQEGQGGSVTGGPAKYFSGMTLGPLSSGTLPVERLERAVSDLAGYDDKVKDLRQYVEGLEKKHKGSSQDVLTQVNALKELYTSCAGFSHYVLNPEEVDGMTPEQAKVLYFYVKIYRIHRSDVAKNYNLLVEGLRNWKVKESGSQGIQWDKELEIADRNLAQFREQGILSGDAANK